MIEIYLSCLSLSSFGLLQMYVIKNIKDNHIMEEAYGKPGPFIHSYRLYKVLYPDLSI